eukprot:TRINITY_DN1206_c4_g1_i1.p1 TRINITY_DN1206_c4_g1~~TRINITY_DN1206_c4_g1_i1.p1  ORF type:complete len:2473 (+),score=922.09 TRINITY_DN1206_c4_g1_i1:111-7529(+)
MAAAAAAGAAAPRRQQPRPTELKGWLMKPRGTDMAPDAYHFRDTVHKVEKYMHLGHGAPVWHRRWVWVDQDRLCYAPAPPRDGDGERKSIELQDVTEVSVLRKGLAIESGLKGEDIVHCFMVLTDAKRYPFVVLREGDSYFTRDQWIQGLRELQMLHGGAAAAAAAPGGSDEDDEEVDGGDDEEEEDEEEEEGDLDDGESDDFGEGAEFDEDEDAGYGSEMSGGDRYAAAHGSPPPPPRQIYLDPKRKAAYASLLDPGGLFASDVEKKSSSKPGSQERWLILTRPTLFILADRLIRKKKKKLPVQQIRGVIENLENENQVAVIWPAGHDFLLTFRDSAEGDAKRKKEDFISHLRVAHEQETQSSTFIRSQTRDIMSVVRLALTQGYRPLECEDLDELNIHNQEAVYPELRANGDSRVYLSDVIIKIRKKKQEGEGAAVEIKEEKESQKILVVTDLAVYYLPDTNGHIDRRIPLSDIEGVYHEPGGQVLFRVGSGRQAYGQKMGDLVFKLLDMEGWTRFLRILLQRDLPGLIRNAKGSDSSVTFKKLKDEQELHRLAKWEHRDAMQRAVDGGNRIYKNILVMNKRAKRGLKTAKKGVTEIDKKALHGAAMVGELGFNLAHGVASHMVAPITGSVAGLGLCKALISACKDELHVSPDKFHGPRGNAVFAALKLPPDFFDAQAVRDELEQRGGDPKLFRKVLEQVGLPGNQKVSYWCHCSVVDTLNKWEKTVIVTQHYLLMFAGGEGVAPTKAGLERKVRLDKLKTVVTCGRRDYFALLFRANEMDLLMHGKDVVQRALLATISGNIHAIHRAERRASAGAADAELELRHCDTFESLKIAPRRTPLEAYPELALEGGECDELQLARTEKVIRLLRPYGDSRVAFSGVAEVYRPSKSKERKGKEEDKKRPYLLALTNCAIYLITTEAQELDPEVVRRLELPHVSALAVNKRDNTEVRIGLDNVTWQLAFSTDLPELGNQRAEAEHEVRIAAALNADLKLVDCVDVTKVQRRAVYGRLLTVRRDELGTIRNALSKALQRPTRKDQEGTHFYRAYPTMCTADAEVKVSDPTPADLLLRTPKADELADCLCSERLWWSCNDRPMPGGAVGGDLRNCDLEVDYESPAEDAGGKADFRIPSRNPFPSGGGARRHKDLLGWIERRLRFAMAEEGRPALSFELTRARRLGFDAGPREVSAVLRNAAQLQARTEETERLRRQLQDAIERCDQPRFAQLARKAETRSSLAEPTLRQLQHRSFRRVMQWSRRARLGIGPTETGSWVELRTGYMSLKEARETCLSDPLIAGYTYHGTPSGAAPTVVHFLGAVPSSGGDGDSGSQAGKKFRRLAFRAASLAPGSPRSPSCSAPVSPCSPLSLLSPVSDAPSVKMRMHAAALGREGGLTHAEGWTAVVRERDELALLQERMRVAAEQADTIQRIRDRMVDMASVKAGKADVDLNTITLAKARKLGCDEQEVRLVRLELTAIVQMANIERLACPEGGTVRDEDARLRRLLSMVWSRLMRLAEQEGDEQSPEQLGDDRDLAEHLEQLARQALPEWRAQRRLLLALEKGDAPRVQQLLEDHREELGEALCQRVENELQMLGKREKIRNTTANVFQHILRRKATSGFADLSDKQLEVTIQQLRDLIPQTKDFESMNRETLQACVLLDCLERSQSMRAERKRKEEAARRNREKAESARSERKRLARELRLQRDQEKQRRHEQFAVTTLRRALEMEKEAIEVHNAVKRAVEEDAPHPMEPTEARRRRTQSCSLLDVALAEQQTNHDHRLGHAVELLRETIVKWDRVIEAIAMTKEDLLRQALEKEVGEVVSSGDRQRLVELLHKCSAAGAPVRLRESDVARIRKQWSARLAAERIRADYVAQLHFEMEKCDPYRLGHLIDQRRENNMDSDDEEIVKAVAFRQELVQRAERAEPTDGEQSAGASASQPGGAAEAPSEAAAVDSDDEDAASLGRTHTVADSPTAAAAKDPAHPEQLTPSSAVLAELHGALRKLKSCSSQEPSGLVRILGSNPLVKTYIDAWVAVLKCHLNPTKTGRVMKKKKPREVIDIFMDTKGPMDGKETGPMWIFSVEQAMDSFKHAKELNPRLAKGDINTFLMHYLMASGRFYQCAADFLTSPHVMERLYGEQSVFRAAQDVQFLSKVLKECTPLRFEFRDLLLPEADYRYLEGINAQAAAESPEPSPSPTRTEASPAPATPARAGGAVPAAPSGAGEAASAAPTVPEPEPPPPLTPEEAAEAAAAERRRQALDLRQFTQRDSPQAALFEHTKPLGKMRLAVRQLTGYFEAARHENPTASGEEIFNGNKHRIVHLLVQMRLCPAILSLCYDGFTGDKGGIGRKAKRHVWQFIEEVVQRCERLGARDLGGTLLPSAVTTTASKVDRELKQEKKTAKDNDKEQCDRKLSALLCYALMQPGHLKAYIDTLYDLQHSDFLHQWYHPAPRSCMLDPEVRSELTGIFSLLSAVRFDLPT